MSQEEKDRIEAINRIYVDDLTNDRRVKGDPYLPGAGEIIIAAGLIALLLNSCVERHRTKHHFYDSTRPTVEQPYNEVRK